jgi:hypothetical protein
MTTKSPKGTGHQETQRSDLANPPYLSSTLCAFVLTFVRLCGKYSLNQMRREELKNNMNSLETTIQEQKTLITESHIPQPHTRNPQKFWRGVFADHNRDTNGKRLHRHNIHAAPIRAHRFLYGFLYIPGSPWDGIDSKNHNDRDAQ